MNVRRFHSERIEGQGRLSDGEGINYTTFDDVENPAVERKVGVYAGRKIVGLMEPSMLREKHDHLLVNNLYTLTSGNDPKNRIFNDCSG